MAKEVVLERTFPVGGLTGHVRFTHGLPLHTTPIAVAEEEFVTGKFRSLSRGFTSILTETRKGAVCARRSILSSVPSIR